MVIYSCTRKNKMSKEQITMKLRNGKVSVLALTVVTLMSSVVAPVNAQSLESIDNNPVCIQTYSEEFPDAYIMEKSYDFSDANITVKDGKLYSKSRDSKLQSDLDEINNNQELLEEIKENIEKGNEIVGISCPTLFVDETIDKNGNVTDSKLMSQDEVKETILEISNEALDNKTRAISSNIITTNSKYSLSYSFVVYNEKPTTGSRYAVAVQAKWTRYGSALSTGAAASGDDFIGIFWGGNFVHTFAQNDTGISGTYNTGLPLICHLEGGVPNASLAWGFSERPYLIGAYAYAKNITAGAYLTKKTLTGGGNETSVTCQYVHTYQSFIGSVSIGGSGGSIGISLCPNKWSIASTISGLVY